MQPSESPPVWRRLRAMFYLWSARVHRHYGIVFGDRHEFASAVEVYGQALGIDPTLGRAYLERGILFWRELDQARRAIPDLTAALRLMPHAPEALFFRGLAHQSAGEYAAAFDDMVRYISSGDKTWLREAVRQRELTQTLRREMASTEGHNL